MKHSIFIITLLISLKGFAQFEYIDQSDLYKKYSIQEVNAYDNDSGLIINDERWLIDNMGRIHSHKLLETEDDTTFSLNLYIYENDLLIKSYDIGIWNTRTNKIDTGITTYIYSDKGQPMRSIYANTRSNTDTSKTIYSYNGSKLISKVILDSYSRIQAIDSTSYYKNSTPHIQSRTLFFPVFSSDTFDPSSKMLQYFDTTGTINLELEFTFDRKEKLIPIRSKSFVYQNDKLIRTIKLYLGTYEHWGSVMRRTEEFYYYDKRGLVTKKEWYSDRKTEPYIIYTYEYK